MLDRPSTSPGEPPERRAAGLVVTASPEESDDTAWLTTFSDLVLQLFAFVVLATYLEAGRTVTAPVAQAIAPPRSVSRPGASPSLDALVEAVDTGEGVAVERAGETVVIRIADAVAFAPGSARLAPEAAAVIEEVRRVALAVPGVTIEVTGHSDDRPIQSALYPSNLDLSLARAAAVARALVEEPALRGRVTARGMGEFQPIASNADAEGRARNRRVEIRLVGAKRMPIGEPDTLPNAAGHLGAPWG